MYELIPNELKALPQWVCAWKGDKAPQKAFERGGASTTDPSTWGDFETAQAAVSEGYYDDIGFVFARENGIVGIDLDAGFGESGLPTGEALDILKIADSYAELSRSGRGFHIFLRGSLPFGGCNNGKGVEIYCEKRYFIMTGRRVTGEDINHNQEAIDYVLRTHFSDVPKTDRKTNDDTKQKIYRATFKRPHPSGKVELTPHYPEIPQGSRHICMVSLAGTLRSAGYGYDYIYNELKRANAAACKPPLGVSELQQIVKSMKKYKE